MDKHHEHEQYTACPQDRFDGFDRGDLGRDHAADDVDMMEAELSEDIARRAAPVQAPSIFGPVAALSMPMAPQDLVTAIMTAASPAAQEAACLALYARGVSAGIALATDTVKALAVGELPANSEEHRYRGHVEAEGRQLWNDNPDGCYWCGSPHHHSSDCAHREG